MHCILLTWRTARAMAGSAAGTLQSQACTGRDRVRTESGVYWGGVVNEGACVMHGVSGVCLLMLHEERG